jgi:DNA-directed RNA polymerase II subunit RPB2
MFVNNNMELLDIFFESNPKFIAKHHLDSYNEFIKTTIQRVVNSMNPFPIVNEGGSVTVTILQPRCLEPDIAKPPCICRLNNETYQCKLIADIQVEYITKLNTVEEVTYLNEMLCHIPIMLHSNMCLLKNMTKDQLIQAGECPYDQGGYFIVNGKEKVIISQERNVNNKLFMQKALDPKKHNIQAYIKCTTETESVFPKTLTLYDSIKHGITVRVTHIDVEIPLFTLFRALGIESDHAIVSMICNTETIPSEMFNFLRPSIVKAGKMNCFTQESAGEWLTKYTEYGNIENILYILQNDFLPNVPFNNFIKAKYLGLLVREFLETAMGKEGLTDRDNYINKRVGISGFLMGDIFKDFYNNFRVATRKEIDNQLHFGKFTTKNLRPDLFKQSEKFRDGLIKSLKGNWGLQKDSSKQGIVQDLSRLSYIGFVSHLRRVSNGIDSSVKLRKPHQLDGSQWGMMCPCESPDGASIGLLKNMAMMCSISSSYKATHIYEALESNEHFGFNRINNLDGMDTRVHLNNNWIGEVKNPMDVVRYFKLLKLNGNISANVSITWKVFKNRIDILTESGRCCRPLLIVENGVCIIDTKRFIGEFTWEKLAGAFHDDFKNPFTAVTDDVETVLQSLHSTKCPIEWVDVEEMNLINIAMDKKQLKPHTTHVEIHPSTILSAYTSTIPFLNYNQAPRNIFSGAQGKQAIGVYATNFESRIDTMGYILHYPQKPIIRTKYSEHLKVNMLPNGENLIVAIMTYTGYNQEDSLIVNEASIQRGMFNITGYNAIVAEEENDNSSSTELTFANPLTYNIPNQKYANYATIDEYGMPRHATKIDEDDCVFGMVSKETSTSTSDPDAGMFEETNKHVSYRNVSVVADKTIQGTIDRVYVSTNSTGLKKAKAKLRKFKIPELGDKMASRHGQKGVVGMIISQEDMPFTKDGLVPDIIVNPHAFPTRMTIGHLLESLIAKYYTLSGNDEEFTPFDDVNVENIHTGLAQCNYNSHGDEILYNGISGTQIACQVFIGPTYYFRLKHMVSDKINYRVPDGKVIGLTKQPPKGRSNGGGMRIGEMETNALVSHGFGAFTKESMMERSDKHTIYVNDGGTIVPYNKEKRIGFENVRALDIPFSMKLMMHELNAASIGTSFNLDNEFSDEDEDYTDLDNEYYNQLDKEFSDEEEY